MITYPIIIIINISSTSPFITNIISIANIITTIKPATYDQRFLPALESFRFTPLVNISRTEYINCTVTAYCRLNVLLYAPKEKMSKRNIGSNLVHGGQITWWLVGIYIYIHAFRLMCMCVRIHRNK